MAAYATKTMRGEDAERPVFRTTVEVTLTIMKDRHESRQVALSAFDCALRILSKGKSAKTGTGTHETLAYDVEPVEGIGEKAAWVPEKHLLDRRHDEPRLQRQSAHRGRDRRGG